MGLIVFLGDIRVGRLAYDRDRRVVSFRFDQSYLDLPERPILSRYFEDFELNSGLEFVGDAGNPPNYFRNCLPEGALRKLVEHEVPQYYFREYHLLERLGPDLPGNVRLIDDFNDVEAGEESVTVREPPPLGSTRFSLAGIQLKLSVLMEPDARITIPVSGVGGKWIAKLPSVACPALPENEFFMLKWAEELGIAVPEYRLASISQIVDLPAKYEPAGENFLIVRRFDRPGQQRIHQEDFAQVFGFPPEFKYVTEVPSDVHYASIGRVIKNICSELDFAEYLKRVIFMLLSGNADAHLKNWSLLYLDGRKPSLSPIYDIVSTIAYSNIDRQLALPLCDETNPYDITYEHFADFALYNGFDADVVIESTKIFVAKARELWCKLGQSPDLPSNVCSAVTRHLNNLLL